VRQDTNDDTHFPPPYFVGGQTYAQAKATLKGLGIEVVKTVKHGNDLPARTGQEAISDVGNVTAFPGASIAVRLYR
jgi:hypothetical protein